MDNAKGGKVLVLLRNDEEKQKFQAVLKTEVDIQTRSLADQRIRPTTFEEFESGGKKDSYDVVLAVVNGCTVQDIDDSEEFYKYYGAAPVFQWVYDQESDVYGFSDNCKEKAPNSECTVQ